MIECYSHPKNGGLLFWDFYSLFGLILFDIWPIDPYRDNKNVNNWCNYRCPNVSLVDYNWDGV